MDFLTKIHNPYEKDSRRILIEEHSTQYWTSDTQICQGPQKQGKLYERD